MNKTKTVAQHASYLRECADIVANIPPEQFNLDLWWSEDGMDFDDERNKMYRIAPGPCGCAVGHLIQREKIAGLKFNKHGHPLTDDEAGEMQGRDEVYDRVAHALGIPSDVAKFLFSQYAYTYHMRKSPRVVANRMRFIANEMEEGTLHSREDTTTCR